MPDQPIDLNILLVEDSPDDAAILIHELESSGFSLKWKRIQTEADFLAELESPPDLILSDYWMPNFTGLRAAKLLQIKGLNIPFILVSGTVGEDVAVEAMKHGVTDYFLKDRISRLGASVHQALEQKRLRDEQKRTEVSLSLFRNLLDRSSDGIEVIDPETGRFLDVNETTCLRLGYARAELLSMGVMDIEVGALDESLWLKTIAETRQSSFKIVEGVHKRKDGSSFPVEVNIRYIKLDRDYLVASVRDITERKRKDEKIQNQLQELQRWHEAMLGREDRILGLKSEVNDLLVQLNRPPLYSQPESI